MLRDARGATGEYSGCCSVGIDGVRLPCRAAGSAVGSVHLDDGDLVGSEVAAELGAEGAGALHAHDEHPAVGVQPLQQALVARRRCGERLGGQVPADGVDDGGLVDVGVGVDPADHLDGL